MIHIGTTTPRRGRKPPAPAWTSQRRREARLRVASFARMVEAVEAERDGVLLEAVDVLGSQRAVAEVAGVSEGHLCHCLAGRARLGAERVVRVARAAVAALAAMDAAAAREAGRDAPRWAEGEED